MDQDGKQPRSDEQDSVRLVGRAEANAAISAGEAVARRSPEEPITPPLATSHNVVSFPLPADVKAVSALPPISAANSDSGEQTPTSTGGPPAGGTRWRFETDKSSTAADAAEDSESFLVSGEGSGQSKSDVSSDDTLIGRRFRTDGEQLGESDSDGNPERAEEDGAGSETNEEVDNDGYDDDRKVWESKAAKLDGDDIDSGGGIQSIVEETLLEAESRMAKVVALNSVSMRQRLLTASVFAVTAGLAFYGGPVWTMVMVLVVVMLSAVELFDGLRRVGYRPATLLALTGVLGVVLGAYFRGEPAVVIVTTLLVLFTFLWYLTSVSKAPPTANIAVTVLGYLWLGLLGSFAALMLQLPERHGMAFFIGAVLCTITYDTGAYLGGSVFGKHLLAPAISPGKTWEGLIGGTVGTLITGALIVGFIHPWDHFNGLLLGVVVAIVAPVGDLSESMIKRDLGIKDMGRLLPGHGGLLDRFDALLFVLPATYFLAKALGLA